MAVMVRFCREQGATWETGVTVVESGLADVKDILDMEGKKVPKVWDYQPCYIYGAMIFPPVEAFKK